MPKPALLLECLRSGTVAALAMMPAGFLFRWAGLRVGHYGPKFAALYLDQPGPLAQFIQHLALGWVSAFPFLWLLLHTQAGQAPLWAGAAYGAAYYVVVNSLALPLWFGDPLPWQLGLPTVLPSLVVHLVFGLSLGLTARSFLHRHQAAAS